MPLFYGNEFFGLLIKNNENEVIYKQLFCNSKKKYEYEDNVLQILNYLVEERNKNEIKNTLTVNIIKNIKANILKDKLIIYNNEINQEQFIDLTNKINNIKQIYT